MHKRPSKDNAICLQDLYYILILKVLNVYKSSYKEQSIHTNVYVCTEVMVVKYSCYKYF